MLQYLFNTLCLFKWQNKVQSKTEKKGSQAWTQDLLLLKQMNNSLSHNSSFYEVKL